MDANLKPISLLSQTLLLLLLLPYVKSNADYNTVVYKKCANQTFSTKYSHSQTLSSLFQQLLPQSSQSKFFKSNVGDHDTAISGLYQCRGDLSNSECYNCVHKLPEMSNTLCKEAESARVQLHGCYFHYEADGVIDESPKHELLHKTCGERKEEPIGFEEMRGAAFLAMESGVVDGHGFYETNYELLHVMAQCEGDLLGGCDCSECVSNAVQILQEECGSSDSGQVYLDKCFVSYIYYPDGIPGNSYQEGGGGNNSGKLVAIVLGGAAALAFVFLFLLFIKSMGKKHDDC